MALHCKHCFKFFKMLSMQCMREGEDCFRLQALLRAPAQPQGSSHVLFDHFWVEAGNQPLPEPSAEAEAGRVHFVATPSVQGHLRSLARAALTRRYPVLLQVLFCSSFPVKWAMECPPEEELFCGKYIEAFDLLEALVLSLLCMEWAMEHHLARKSCGVACQSQLMTC